MPNESKHEQIAAYMAARLAEITTAAGFWYTIERVVRVDQPEFHHWEEVLDAKVKCFALVFPGEDEPVLARSTISVTKQMALDVVLSRNATIDRVTARNAPTEPERIFPTNAADRLPLQWTVQNRLLKDAKDKLNQSVAADPAWGGLITELLLPEHENRQYKVDGWDCVHLPMAIVYHHPRITS